jgi:hypothetical protein
MITDECAVGLATAVVSGGKSPTPKRWGSCDRNDRCRPSGPEGYRPPTSLVGGVRHASHLTILQRPTQGCLRVEIRRGADIRLRSLSTARSSGRSAGPHVRLAGSATVSGGPSADSRNDVSTAGWM